MFCITPDPTFSAEVRLTVPGREAKAAISVIFKHKGRRALKAWQAKADESRDDDAAWLGEVIAGWDGPADKAGNPVPYSLHALADLLDEYPASGVEIYQAYLAQFTPARLGN
jgi:hypothetical protein